MENLRRSTQEADNTMLYACCPRCCRTVGRFRRCDGMELNCTKCGSPLRVVIDQDTKVLVELVRREHEKVPA